MATTILSLSPDALILPLRVVDAEGIGFGFDVAEGILTAITEGVDMINLSLSMNQPSELVNLLITLALSNGIEVYAAAGNTGSEGVLFPASFSGSSTSNAMIPANMPNAVIGVAAVNSDFARSSFSSFGDEVDLCGLGTRVCAMIPTGELQAWQGTSMACATATGVAALLRSRLPAKFVQPIGELMIETAQSVDVENPDMAGLLGAGAFDAQAAFAAAQR